MRRAINSKLALVASLASQAQSKAIEAAGGFAATAKVSGVPPHGTK